MLNSKWKLRTLFLLVSFQINSGNGYTKTPTLKDFECDKGKCQSIQYEAVVPISIEGSVGLFKKGEEINVYAVKDNYLLVTKKSVENPKESDFKIVHESFVGKKSSPKRKEVRQDIEPTKTDEVHSPQQKMSIQSSSIIEQKSLSDRSNEMIEPGVEIVDDYEEDAEFEGEGDQDNLETNNSETQRPDIKIEPSKPIQNIGIPVNTNNQMDVTIESKTFDKKTKETNEEVIESSKPEEKTISSSGAIELNQSDENTTSFSETSLINKPEEKSTGSSGINQLNKPQENTASLSEANQFIKPEENATSSSEANKLNKPEENATSSSEANQVNKPEENAPSLSEANKLNKPEEKTSSPQVNQLNKPEENVRTSSEANKLNNPEEKTSSSQIEQFNEAEENTKSSFPEANQLNEPGENTSSSSENNQLSKPEENLTNSSEPNKLKEHTTSSSEANELNKPEEKTSSSKENQLNKPEENTKSSFSEANQLNEPGENTNSSSETNQLNKPEENMSSSKPSEPKENTTSLSEGNPLNKPEENRNKLPNQDHQNLQLNQPEQTMRNIFKFSPDELSAKSSLSQTTKISSGLSSEVPQPTRKLSPPTPQINESPKSSMLLADSLPFLKPESEQLADSLPFPKPKYEQEGDSVLSSSKINRSPSSPKSVHVQYEKIIDSVSSEENIEPEEVSEVISILYESLENLRKSIESLLFDYMDGKNINSALFAEYPSLILLFNSTLLLFSILLLNCLSIKKCDSTMKGKLFKAEKKLLEKNIEHYKVSEIMNENDRIKEENQAQKDKLNKLTSKISQLQDEEAVLKNSLDEFKTKYESLEEASNKKNIKKNYELLMGEVIIQKKKLDELAAGMEERAESLKQEKTNIESLLKVQAEEHGKIVNDYRMLLSNLELENKELRDIVQTLSTDSDATQQLLEAVTLQVQLSNLEKENENLTHQLDGEREAHKLLEDHQRMTQKEVNDLRESYEVSLKEKKDLTNKLKYITDYFQQLEDKLKKEIAVKDDLLNDKLGDDDSLAKALMNLRKDNSVLTEENNILRNKYESLKVELTDQKNEDKLSKTKLENERDQIWMAWRAAERKIEGLNLDNKILRSKLVAMGTKSETSFREMHTQTYEDPDKNLSRTSSLYIDHTSPVPQPFIPNYAIPLPLLSDEEMRQLYDPSSGNFDENVHNGYQTDEDNNFPSNDYRLPPLGGGTYSPPTLDNIPVPNIPLPLDNDVLWKLQKMTDPVNNSQTWNMSSIEPSNDDEGPSYKNSQYSRKRTEDSMSSVSSSRRSFV